MKDFSHPFHLFLWLLLGVLHASAAQATGWLSTSGNHIINPDGSVWIGRGANLHDTRSCGGGFLVDDSPINDNLAGVTEVKRRIDVLTDQWKASFIRRALETDQPGVSYVDDANYRSNIIEIVNYIGTKTSQVVTGLANGTVYTFTATASDILAVKGRSGLVMP
jgi:hypothetical protein